MYVMLHVISAAMEKARLASIDCNGGGGGDIAEEMTEQQPPTGHNDVRATMGAHLTEMAGQLGDLGGLEALVAGDIDLDPLGVEFDLSQLPEADNLAGAGGGAVEESTAASVVVGHVEKAGGGSTNMDIPANLKAGKSWEAALAAVGGGGVSPFGMQGGFGSVAGPMSRDTSFGMAGIVGGGPLSRDASFGITGHAAASSMMRSSSSGVVGGEHLSRQSSLDINTIMQVRERTA